MAADDRDPYRALGVKPDASDAELRAAYRRLVQLHHPDHNGGSAESALAFEAVQSAYAEALGRRAAKSSGQSSRTGPNRSATEATGRRERHQSDQPAPDPRVESRIAELERELRAAQDARERARAAAQAAARAAAADAKPARASDEELGYVKTDDSFTQILADARTELSKLYAEVRERGESLRRRRPSS